MLSPEERGRAREVLIGLLRSSGKRGSDGDALQPRQFVHRLGMVGDGEWDRRELRGGRVAEWVMPSTLASLLRGIALVW